MTQVEINTAINAAFNNLSVLSEQVYDYWIMQLYDDQSEMIAEKWNKQTLKMMETDVMQNS